MQPLLAQVCFMPQVAVPVICSAHGAHQEGSAAYAQLLSQAHAHATSATVTLLCFLRRQRVCQVPEPVHRGLQSVCQAECPPSVPVSCGKRLLGVRCAGQAGTSVRGMHTNQVCMSVKHQPCFTWPGGLTHVPLQALYATVLSLGFLFTGYLQWSGLTSAEVSG
jgi:hypothetical protein